MLALATGCDANLRTPDTGVPPADTGVPEDIVAPDASEPADTGAADGTSPDTGTVDTGTADTGTADTGGTDASVDVPTDTRTPPTDGGCTISPPAPMQPVSAALLPERRVTCGCRARTPSVTPGSDATRFLLRGRIVTPAVVHAAGEVLVVGNLINCVGPTGMCASRPEASNATIIETGGLIYPGLIDGHNHVAYNWLPEWVAGRLFMNRYQWQRATAYDTYITPYRVNVGMHECAMAKYGEARAIFAGTTTIQGGPNRTCTRVLARNPEFGADFGGVDRHATNILGISTVDTMAAANLRRQMDDGSLTTYIIHLGEGIDDMSRAEFTDLLTKNLLTQATVMVHGTAFLDSQHMQAGAARSRIVWSPRSNVALYGDTTDVRSALMRGVLVSLAPDWTPSGAPDILQELRFARNVGRNRWPGLLTDRKLVEMVTSDAARVLDRHTLIGSLEAGRYADLMVIPDTGCDPYSSLVDAVAADVELVMVGGRPMYGTSSIMRALPAAALTGCEDTTVCSSTRVACVARPGASDMMNQTLEQITTELRSFYPMVLPLVPRCP